MTMQTTGLVISFVALWMIGEVALAKSLATKPANWIVHNTAPDGSPGSGALAVVIPPDPSHEAVLNREGVDIIDDPALKRIYADATGAAHIPRFDSSGLLLVIRQDGYATANAAALAKSRNIQLQKWCIVRGTAMVGTKPAANRLVSVEHIDPSNGTIMEHIDPIRDGTTDASGHFRIDHVMAGDTFAAIDEPFAPSSREGISVERQYFHLQPGETKTVQIGGEGRPVVGRFILPPKLADRSTWKFGVPPMLETPPTQTPLPMPDDVRAGSIAQQDAWYQKFIHSDAGKAALHPNAWHQLATRIHGTV